MEFKINVINAPPSVHPSIKVETWESLFLCNHLVQVYSNLCGNDFADHIQHNNNRCFSRYCTGFPTLQPVIMKYFGSLQIPNCILMMKKQFFVILHQLFSRYIKSICVYKNKKILQINLNQMFINAYTQLQWLKF